MRNHHEESKATHGYLNGYRNGYRNGYLNGYLKLFQVAVQRHKRALHQIQSRDQVGERQYEHL